MKKMYLMPAATLLLLSDADICTLSEAAEGRAMDFVLDMSQFN